MALLEACADRVPWPPIRTCANTAEPTEAHSQAVKDHLAAPNLNGDSANCEPADTIPTAPAHRNPDAHRAAEARGRGQAGTHIAGLPPAISDATPTGMRSPFGQTATTVASETANALLS